MPAGAVAGVKFGEELRDPALPVVGGARGVRIELVGQVGDGVGGPESTPNRAQSRAVARA
ncbi:hypothetical protein [Streptomyces sp. NPDC057301]|uniref:hypothetical protein n=1 Tax=Streptomyces sp. NPDC057301 TaxID=3346093 RepID=UPI003639F5F0